MTISRYVLEIWDGDRWIVEDHEYDEFSFDDARKAADARPLEQRARVIERTYTYDNSKLVYETDPDDTP